MRGWIAALLAAGMLAACSPMQDISGADAQIAAFHKALNAQDFATIYAQSAPEMKAATTPDAHTKLMSAIHRKLGNFQSGADTSWNDNVATGGHFLTIGYAAKYDRGTATETFVYGIDGARALLVSYNVNSTALILN